MFIIFNHFFLLKFHGITQSLLYLTTLPFLFLSLFINCEITKCSDRRDNTLQIKLRLREQRRVYRRSVLLQGRVQSHWSRMCGR